MKKVGVIPLLLLILTVACGNLALYFDKTPVLTPVQRKILSYLPQNSVIAHRGTTFWAPEETEAAMRWARNIGADYLEFDLQRTKDGYLIALHDENLQRTTDIAQKFPDRKDQPVSQFTYQELLALDAGTWFNNTYPDRARHAFKGLDILTLEDVVQISEGKRIKRESDGKRILKQTKAGKWTSVYEQDLADNGNRPGIYPETKVPHLFPGIEEDLKNELIRLGWYPPTKAIPVQKGKIGIANTKARTILQTFSKESLTQLHAVFTDPIPICFLLWRGNEPDDLPNDQLDTFRQWVNFGIAYGATIIGPSIGGEPNNYTDLMVPENIQLVKESGLYIHAYSFDTPSQLKKYSGSVNGIFSNKADEAIFLYKHTNPSKTLDSTAVNTLESLGY